MLGSIPWTRFVALGDSVAEGVGEAVDGFPHAGWADTIAFELRRARPELEYLNLGVRNRFAAQVRREQLERALAFAPDLAMVAAGGNDMLLPTFDPERTEHEVEEIVAALTEAGALVLTVGLFDITQSSLILEEYRLPLRQRLQLLSERTEQVARRHGAVHLDFTSHPASADDAIYSSDRVHLNGRGHAIAAAGTLEALAAHLESNKEAA